MTRSTPPSTPEALGERSVRERAPRRIERASTLALLGFCALALSGCGAEAPSAPKTLEIRVASAVQRDQPIAMEMVGETMGSSDIPIRARVEGVLVGMHFREGRNVEKDELLYTIDPVPYESEVVEAEGSLAEAVTNLAKAKSDLDRIRPLAEMDAVSQSDLDGAIARYEAALGSRQSAAARVEQARIRLGYTRILAPIAGRIGISTARVGEFVGRAPNPVVLNFVSQIDPIRVRFSIDERTYLTLARRLKEYAESGEAGPPEQRTFALILADGTEHPFEGSVIAANASVDPKTGTFTLEANFPNPDGLVLAGQFARVRATTEVRRDAILVPSRAVSELQGNFRVFVVGPDGGVEVRSIEVGPQIDNLRLVESGLRPGERVALEIMKLRPGMKIEPIPVTLDGRGLVIEPTEEAAPAAGDSAAIPRRGRMNTRV